MTLNAYCLVLWCVCCWDLNNSITNSFFYCSNGVCGDDGDNFQSRRKWRDEKPSKELTILDHCDSIQTREVVQKFSFSQSSDFFYL